MLHLHAGGAVLKTALMPKHTEAGGSEHCDTVDEMYYQHAAHLLQSWSQEKDEGGVLQADVSS